MYADLKPIADKAEVLLLELSEMIQNGPRFRIIHRFRKAGTECHAGEEVAAVHLLHRGRAIPLPLPLALRLVFDYLARHHHMPQSASQITAGMRVSPFYVRHGLNAGVLSRRKISRSSVKEYVKRIRKAMLVAFRESQTTMNPPRVLVSMNTVGNEAQYRMRAVFEWLHIDELPYPNGNAGSRQ